METIFLFSHQPFTSGAREVVETSPMRVGRWFTSLAGLGLGGYGDLLPQMTPAVV